MLLKQSFRGLEMCEATWFITSFHKQALRSWPFFSFFILFEQNSISARVPSALMDRPCLTKLRFFGHPFLSPKMLYTIRHQQLCCKERVSFCFLLECLKQRGVIYMPPSFLGDQTMQIDGSFEGFVSYHDPLQKMDDSITAPSGLVETWKDPVGPVGCRWFRNQAAGSIHRKNTGCFSIKSCFFVFVSRIFRFRCFLQEM